MEVLKISLDKKTSTGTIMDRVTSFESACAELGMTGEDIFEIRFASPDLKGLAKSMLALFELTIICNALNEGWVADWSDDGQRKYYPWLKFTPGSGFRLYGCAFVRVDSGLGARPILKTEALARYVATQFPELCHLVTVYNSKQSEK